MDLDDDFSLARAANYARVGDREVSRSRLLFMGDLSVRSKPIAKCPRGRNPN